MDGPMWRKWLHTSATFRVTQDRCCLLWSPFARLTLLHSTIATLQIRVLVGNCGVARGHMPLEAQGPQSGRIRTEHGQGTNIPGVQGYHPTHITMRISMCPTPKRHMHRIGGPVCAQAMSKRKCPSTSVGRHPSQDIWYALHVVDGLTLTGNGTCR